MADRLVDLLERETITLIVSLPDNDISLARAAMAGGADALKLHINVHHAASGTHFGSLEQERPRLEAILDAAGSIPVGLVTGPGNLTDGSGGGPGATAEEMDMLSSMGFDFLDLYAHHMPAWMWLHEQLSLVVAVDAGYDANELSAIGMIFPDAVEASIIPAEGYGAPLTVRDLSRYRMLADLMEEAPLIVPTQRKIRPAESEALWRIGVTGLMIGAVVTGQDAAGMEACTRAFRSEIDDLGSF